MAFLRGVLGGTAALVVCWLSMFVLSRTLHRLPWTRLATLPRQHQLPPPPADEILAPEPVRTAGNRGTVGSVPMYREKTPEPRWAPAPRVGAPAPRVGAPAPRVGAPAPEETPGSQRQPAPRAAARSAARPGPASVVEQSRQRIQSMQDLGGQLGAPAASAAPQGPAAGSAMPEGQPASNVYQQLPPQAAPEPRAPEPEPEPQQGAWDQGVEEADPAAPKTRRFMRAVPQGGTAVPQQPAASEEEDQ